MLAEGGGNVTAVRRRVELGREPRGRTGVAAVACGMYGTLTGIAAGLSAGQRGLGGPARERVTLRAEVRWLQLDAFGWPRGTRWPEGRSHCGGYAHVSPEPGNFGVDFADHGGRPPLDHARFARPPYGLATLADEGAFAHGSTVSAAVTGFPAPGAGPSRQRSVTKSITFRRHQL